MYDLTERHRIESIFEFINGYKDTDRFLRLHLKNYRGHLNILIREEIENRSPPTLATLPAFDSTLYFLKL